MQSETKNCQNCKKSFIIELEDFNFYEKISVPPPTFCPLCRAQRRLAFRNERKLFKVTDAFTGKEIFSTYPKESGRSIISREAWFGDEWDAMDHGIDVDFSQPFLKQLWQLMGKVPMYNFNTTFMVNSSYSFNSSRLRNCYLLCNSNESEDCLYGNGVDSSKNCVDNSHVKSSELCYECFWLDRCYQCHFTQRCEDSRNLWFCRGCVGSNDCFGCANLINASYRIFNKQYTKEEYQAEIARMGLDTLAGIEKGQSDAKAFWDTLPVKNIQGVKNVNSSGSYITHCRNVNDSYLIREGENMRYCQYLQVPRNKDNYDVCIWGEYIELCYETIECGENSYNNRFSWNCWPACRNCEYSTHLFSSSDCFGCTGLKKKQYCILNKQYTKEEYEELVPKIKKHMDEMPFVDSRGIVYKYGEFFPIELSPFGYNNTIAIQHFPLSKEEALGNNYGWIDRERGEYDITKKAAELPEKISDTTDEVLKEVIECENCKFAYRIQPNELAFYRRENLPLPHLCNECRYERRIADRLSIQLYGRACMCAGKGDKTGVYKNIIAHQHAAAPCPEKFKTGYAPERLEIVYCEKCYQQEVY